MKLVKSEVLWMGMVPRHVWWAVDGANKIGEGGGFYQVASDSDARAAVKR